VFFAKNCSKKPQNNRMARQKKNNNNKKNQVFFWWISDFFDFLFRVVGVVSQKGKRESFFSSYFLDFNLCPSFDFLISSSSSFFLAVTLWFSLFFLFRFFVHGFITTPHFSELLIVFLGTWGDFLRWFTYFFLFQRDNYIEVFVLFSCDFWERIAETKTLSNGYSSRSKKSWIGLLIFSRFFFWLRE